MTKVFDLVNRFPGCDLLSADKRARTQQIYLDTKMEAVRKYELGV